MKAKSMENLLLAADIGGTKTLLGLFEPAEVRPRPVVVRAFGTLDYADLNDMISEFIKFSGEARALATACFGVAGPVIDQAASLTNVPWRIEAGRVWESDRGVESAVAITRQ